MTLLITKMFVTMLITNLFVTMRMLTINMFVTQLVTRAVGAPTRCTLAVASSALRQRHCDRPNKKADARRIDAIPPELLGEKERL